MMLLDFMLTFIGFIALSLSMKRHFIQCSPQSTHTPLRLLFLFRVMGYLLLMFSATLCIATQGLALGLVFWTGLITLAALLQSLLLTYRPQWVMPAGLISLVLGAASSIAN